MQQTVILSAAFARRIPLRLLNQERFFASLRMTTNALFPQPVKPAPQKRACALKSSLVWFEINANQYAERRATILRGGGGITVAILRIMAKTRRLSPSESVVLYFLISERKRISSSESSPNIF